jgi:Ala-tRNA(Pro) deacylase
MPLQKLKQFLDSQDVRYVVLSHSPAYTAQEIAASAHIPGKEVAKTVIVRLDGKMVMAVLPASYSVDLNQLRELAGGDSAELATEDNFQSSFPGCEVGAMPPFGNLFDMPVYVDETLTQDEKVAFTAGTHHELIQLNYEDFERLVNPTVGQFGVQ